MCADLQLGDVYQTEHKEEKNIILGCLCLFDALPFFVYL